MESNKLNELIELGFVQSEINKRFYYFNMIRAAVIDEYIYFEYGTEDLPIIDSIDRIKSLIKAIYDKDIDNIEVFEPIILIEPNKPL